MVTIIRFLVFEILMGLRRPMKTHILSFEYLLILSYFYHHSRRYTTRITVLSPFTFPICPCGHFYSNLSPFHSSLMGAFPRLSTPIFEAMPFEPCLHSTVSILGSPSLIGSFRPLFFWLTPFILRLARYWLASYIVLFFQTQIRSSPEQYKYR